MNLSRILLEFKNEEDFENYLIDLRWRQGVECPKCSSRRVSRKRKEKRFICNGCNRSFSIRSGTVFHSSKLPLSKWFLAISLVIHAKKGLSSLQLARTISVNKDTAWYMQKRLREAMWEDFTLKGLIEVDETYVGGSLRNKHYHTKKKNPSYFGSGMMHKTPVLGMVQRQGKILVRVIDHADGENIKPILSDKLAPECVVVTDGFGGYAGLDKLFNQHVRLNHAKHQRAQGKYNMSSIEGFWTMIKRAVFGQYHKVSREYLQLYLNELAFKFNNPNEGFNTLLCGMLKCQLPLSG